MPNNRPKFIISVSKSNWGSNIKQGARKRCHTESKVCKRKLGRRTQIRNCIKVGDFTSQKAFWRYWADRNSIVSLKTKWLRRNKHENTIQRTIKYKKKFKKGSRWCWGINSETEKGLKTQREVSWGRIVAEVS